MHRKLPLLILSLFFVCCVFVTADFFGVFGIREHRDVALHELYLRPRNRIDNSPVEGTVARCFQQGNRNACSQKIVHKPGFVAIKFSGIKIKHRSLLFDRGVHFAPSKDPTMQVMLIHPDYMTQIETIDIPSHIDNPEKEYVVLMQPRGGNGTSHDLGRER